MNRVQLWSCGGGRQSAGIAALIIQGRLPKPDHAGMVRLEWEVGGVWEYVDTYIRPALKGIGVPFTVISRKEVATFDFWGGAERESILLPVYSDQSGKPSKLPEFCSATWKRDCVMRWAGQQPGWRDRGLDCWIGISFDERHRRRAARKKWFQPAYPLLDMLPKMLPVSACLAAVEEMGWPAPPRSRCYHCPNQSDREWAELTPAEWAAACDRDDEIRRTDAHAFLHRKMIPLRQVTLEPSTEGESLFTGGCSAGTCY